MNLPHGSFMGRELRSTVIVSHYHVRELRSTIIISAYRFRLSTLFQLKTGGWFLSDLTLCITTGDVIRTRASATHPLLAGRRRISSFSAALPSRSASFAKSYHRSNNLIRRSYSGSSCCHLFFGHAGRNCSFWAILYLVTSFCEPHETEGARALWMSSACLRACQVERSGNGRRRVESCAVSVTKRNDSRRQHGNRSCITKSFFVWLRTLSPAQQLGDVEPARFGSVQLPLALVHFGMET
jgi:hypothetical protein